MDLPVYAYAIIGVIVIGGIVQAVRWAKNLVADNPRTLEDRAIPLRKFAQGAMFIITGTDDYGYEDQAEVREGINEWWGIESGEEAIETVQELTATQATEPSQLSWDLVRAIHVSRMAAGAGYLDNDTSWRLVEPAAKKLQASFNDWPEVGDAYVVAKVAWEKRQELEPDNQTQDNVAMLKDGFWKEVPFKAPLG